jgi:hypothetical protein
MGVEAVFDPVGPLPAEVYWRRRGVVLVVAVLTLFLLAKSCGGGSPKKTAALTPNTPTASAEASTATRLATSAAPTGPAACEDTQLSLETRVAAQRYPAGAPPQFTLIVTNTGPGSCTRDMSTAQRGFVVTTGGVRAWSSTDCVATTAQVQTLEPKKPVELDIAWNRHLSDAACAPATTARLAANGTYVVTGVLGSLRKEAPPFVLAA